LNTTFLAGGKSPARVVLIRINDSANYLVAKIGEKTFIREEIYRFREFIDSWDPQLQPSVYMHKSCGVIVFGLISGDSSTGSPAPSLEDRLSNLWNSEMYEPLAGSSTPDYRDLSRSIATAAMKLLSLNKMPATNQAVECYGKPVLWAFDQLEVSGKLLGFS